MAVETRTQRDQAASVTASTLRTLAEAGHTAGAAPSPEAALNTFARAAAEVCRSDVAIVRVLEADGAQLTVRAVHAASPALAAFLEGSHLSANELTESVPTTRIPELPNALQLPIELGATLLGSLELLRAGEPFDDGERLLARICANELGFALRALGAVVAHPGGEKTEQSLVLAGDALVAGLEDSRTDEQVARLAAEAAGAEASFLWQATEGDPELIASFGDTGVDRAALLSGASVALESRDFLTQEHINGAAVTTARLGEPASGVLQLVFAHDPDERALAGLATFALRAAHTLEAGERARRRSLELQRTRALLTVVGQATEELSLGHTLSTGVERTADLLEVERVAVYLRADSRLVAAAGRGVGGAHVFVAEALLGLLLGPYRGRGIVAVPDVAREPLLSSVRGAAAESEIEAAVGLPLIAGQDVIGLLAVYPQKGWTVSDHGRSLLAALAAQLAVAVQNAMLHEEAKRLASEREAALMAEQQASRRLRALYEVSRSFAQSLSLDATLDALAQNAVELLGVDAAAIRMPDARRELLTTRALHVAEARLEEAVGTILARPQAWGVLPLQRLFRTRRPLVLDANLARELGGSHELLAPFLEKGSTAAVLPIATPAEVVATLTIVSFDPGRPIGEETLETALSVAAQAALAIDNGRLYQQQKEFADTMQRSLLPRTRPQPAGLQIGDVYESSARVDVGGDLYDFLELADGRLAVVLGDVTGHGIEATADMAMAKYVFRSLAREHPEPGGFLAAANDVVVGELATGKFITMTYLTVDAATGTVVAASAGHPAPLVVTADRMVTPIKVGGLALGVDTGQTYIEDRAVLTPGSAVVVITDGVVESRRDGELYGSKRLAGLLGDSVELPATEIARSVVRDCRAYAGGRLSDDCAVVVIKKLR